MTGILKTLTSTLLTSVLIAMMALPSSASTDALNPLLDSYLKASREENRLEQTLYGSRIRKLLFEHPGSQTYIEGLEAIDRRMTEAPEATLDLARRLQFHWEAQYGTGLSARHSREVRAGTEIGAVIGITALGAALLSRPHAAPRYFRLVRHLFPLAGAGAGAAAPDALAALGIRGEEIPPSPAHVMNLGLGSIEEPSGDDTLTKDIAILMTSATASSVAYDLLKLTQALKWANRAATPAKVHPAALAASIAIGVIVEGGLETAIDATELKRLRGKLTTAASQVRAAALSGDAARALKQAHLLTQASIQLSAYLRRPALDALKRFGEQADSAAFESLMIELRSLGITGQIDSDYEGYLVRARLARGGHAGIRDLSLRAQTRATQYERSFERWLLQAETNRGSTLNDSERKDELTRFLSALDQSKDRELSSRLIAGKGLESPASVLLQTAAFLRNTGIEYLDEYSELLQSMVGRNEFLFSEVSSQ